MNADEAGSGDTACIADGNGGLLPLRQSIWTKIHKTAELWLQAIAGGEPTELAVAQAERFSVQFALMQEHLSSAAASVPSRSGWRFRTVATADGDEQCEEADQHFDGGRRRHLSPDGNSVLFTSRGLFRDARPSRRPTMGRRRM